MGKYVRKTRDIWVIETNYGCGWEEEMEYDYEDRKFAIEALKEYLICTNHYGGTARLVKRREKICPTQANV